MKKLHLTHFLSKDFFFIKLPKFKWGKFAYIENNVYCSSQFFYILNIFFLFLHLKKLLCFINIISFNKGVCLSYFPDKYKSFFINRKVSIKNFYIIFINKMFGFLSNFVFFLKRISKISKYTDYNSKRFPSIVFLSKKTWKTFFYFIYIFETLKIPSIKSLNFLDYEASGCYNITIGKCYSFFQMSKNVYFLNNLKFRKW